LNPQIRDFRPEDYEVVVDLVNRSFPEYPDTVEEWKHWDAHRNKDMKFRRFVAELDGEVVGVGSYNQWEGMFHPQKFGVEITVDPDRREKGVGSALFEHIGAALKPFDPITYWTEAREDHAHSRRFVEKRGYVEVMREWENHLVPADFDPKPWEGKIERVEASGIQLRTFGELRETDPEFFPKLFDLVEEVDKDVPTPDPSTPVNYEKWVERVEKNPNLMPDGYFIGVEGDRYVGLSTLSKSQVEDFLYTGLTGTRRDYRRRGLALALKLKAIEYCCEREVPLVKTWNATTNTGMLAINEALGFVKQPAWINYALELQPEG
jgi:GNAT superfamily N-acetyltransferase